ncbi:tRNA pseudouridine(38-40) synthase TruA [Zobellella iuensis]|uniref:tRNA pseudouridine synthase A n=1 Tax=Zobellella iuensis TaxID=2803811 RepID=A0ABS1QSL0_9GAMM|nr:tRNA pseudouridine(38-40) synthase TruA [Zobellella iuensis]MBL1377860.1 tRNA pseudouridine(38-40) synthase TruA [Zobellella iuensis]
MRIALGIEYDGSRYYGWQRQREVSSIQEEVEKALSKIADHPVEVQCAGRTDAGVHGTGQVVHFDTRAERQPGAWTLGMNANLPADIAVRWVKPVNDDFHARFSATARRYRYIIFNHNMRPAIHGRGVSHYAGPIDAEKMHEAGQCLLGERDFSAFRAVQCQSRSPYRNIMHLTVKRYGHYVVLDIKANAFLHHMVRNITGSLLAVGMGQAEAGWVKEILEGRDRNLAGVTAKAGGLYLVEVDYPAHFGLPSPVPGPLWLPDHLIE